MDEKTVRQQLDEVRSDLTKNEEEHDVLVSLVRGLEGWLRLHGGKATPSILLPVASSPRPRAKAAQSGAPSLRGAVAKVLKEARGEPLHSREILQRAQEMGANTNAKNPVGIIDLVALSLRNQGGLPIERTATRTWRWAGPPNGETSPPGKQEAIVKMG